LHKAGGIAIGHWRKGAKKEITGARLADLVSAVILHLREGTGREKFSQRKEKVGPAQYIRSADIRFTSKLLSERKKEKKKKHPPEKGKGRENTKPPPDTSSIEGGLGER